MSIQYPTTDVFARAAADARRLLANSTAAFVGGPVVGTLLRRPESPLLGEFARIGGAQRITFRCNLVDVQALTPPPELRTDLLVTDAAGTEWDCRLITRTDNALRGECLLELEVLAP